MRVARTRQPAEPARFEIHHVDLPSRRLLTIGPLTFAKIVAGDWGDEHAQIGAAIKDALVWITPCAGASAAHVKYVSDMFRTLGAAKVHELPALAEDVDVPAKSVEREVAAASDATVADVRAVAAELVGSIVDPQVDKTATLAIVEVAFAKAGV